MVGIVIDGLDTYRDLGLLLSSKTLSPPQPKTYLVDIPGGDGAIDLTEAVGGGVVFGNRVHEFAFTYVGSPEEFERVKTEVSNRFNGRRLSYTLPWDDGYVYTGRFRVKDYPASRPLGTLQIAVEADPYKLKERCTYRVNAAGGIVVTPESGRRPACPTFEFASETIVACGDVVAQMQPGSYKVNDLWLHEGVNELYLNSYLGEGNVAAEEHMGVVVEDVWDRRVSDLMWEGVRGGAALVEDWERDTVEMHWDERVVDAEFAVSGESERYAVYVQYEWEDL